METPADRGNRPGDDESWMFIYTERIQRKCYVSKEICMAVKIVLIGAGSAMFGLGSVGNIYKSKILEGSDIVLHDIDPAALSRVEKTARSYLEEHDLNFSLTATTDRGEALKGADFCIIAIESGNRYVLWEQDWKVPLQFGVTQVYGENGGPGGLFHSLRIIPPILEICRDVMRIVPQAWVLNLSNPMTRICTAVHMELPELRLVGLCHEVVSLQEHLPTILDTDLDNLDFMAGGLNHFSFLLKARYLDSGRDAYPDIRARAPAYFESLPEKDYGNLGAIKNMISRAQSTILASEKRKHIWAERELFKVLLEKFGYLPITTDSHIGEYVGWAHSVVDHKGILDFYDFYKKWCLEQVPEQRIRGAAEEEYWREIPIIEGIVADTGHQERAVNIPNIGFIANLPTDVIVEIPAMVNKEGIHGDMLGELPEGLRGLMLMQVSLNRLTAQAVIQKSKDLALQALLLDPVVNDAIAAEDAFDTILELQHEYLGYLK